MKIKKLMKIILVSLSIFLLVACTHQRTFQEAYAEGSYIESINLLATKIEKKSEANFKQTDAAQLRQLVTEVMNKYENELANTTKSNDEQRQEIYEKLLELNQRLSDHFYSSELAFFLDKYPSERLKQNIANFYTQQANAIPTNSAGDYEKRAALYKKSLDRYYDKNIEKAYIHADTKYRQLAAQTLYNLAKQEIRSGDYNAALACFRTISVIYKPLGQYKDTEKLARYYEKKARNKEAFDSYSQGEKIAKNATRSYQYRQAATNYQHAANTYAKYGNYRDSEQKARDYANKGKIRLYVTGNANSFSNFVEDYFKNDDAIILVYNSSDSDITINLSEDERYSEDGGSVTNDTKKNGEKEYNLQTETLVNNYSLNLSVNISGLSGYYDRFSAEKSSRQVKYTYTGDKPSYEFDSTDGNYYSRSELRQQAEDDIKSSLSNYLSRLSSAIHQL